MTAAANKQLMQHAFAELAKGNGKPLGDCMADDFTWNIIGTTPWSGSFRGKKEVQDKLLRPLFANFASHYTNTPLRMIAEDDYVVVESRGRVTARSGKPYNNEYCFVIRFADGKMRELTEYSDTALMLSALQAPEASVATDT